MIRRWATGILAAAICLACWGVPSGAAEMEIRIPQSPEWSQLVAEFEKANPHLEVTVVYEESYDQLMAMIAGGTPPDISRFDRFRVGEWALQGLLLPLDDLLSGIDPTSHFVHGPLQEAVFEGRLYAVPFDMDVRGLFWNVPHLEEAGLDSRRGPTTWDELNAFADRLTRYGPDGVPERLGLIPWWGNWGYRAWIWTFGGDYFNYESFSPTLNRPENVAAYEWMAEYARTYGTASALGGAGTQAAQFSNGRVSMIPGHHYMPITNPREEVWGGPVPHPPGGRNGTWSGGFSFVVPSGARNLDAAARFLRYVSDPNVQVPFFETTRRLPATRDGLSAVAGYATPLELVFLAQAGESRWRPPFDNLMSSALNRAQNQVINLEVPARQALDQAQEEVLAAHAELWGTGR